MIPGRWRFGFRKCRSRHIERRGYTQDTPFSTRQRCQLLLRSNDGISLPSSSPIFSLYFFYISLRERLGIFLYSLWKSQEDNERALLGFTVQTQLPYIKYHLHAHNTQLRRGDEARDGFGECGGVLNPLCIYFSVFLFFCYLPVSSNVESTFFDRPAALFSAIVLLSEYGVMECKDVRGEN